MMKAAGANGWLDYDRIMMESRPSGAHSVKLAP